MKIIKFTLVILTLIASISACKKDAVVGPTGPTGPTGNANVKSSIFIPDSISWYGDSVGQWKVNLSDSNITANILDKGAVLVYASTGAGNNTLWESIPTTFTFFIDSNIVHFYYTTGLFTVYINKYEATKDGQIIFPGNHPPFNTYKRFKIVCIEGN